MQSWDGLKINDNKALKALMTKSEEILFSGELVKINKNKKKQKRNIVITTESLYNIRSDNLITSAQSLFSDAAQIKRRIPIEHVKAIVYARLGNEFIIHVVKFIQFFFEWFCVRIGYFFKFGCVKFPGFS